MTIQLTPPSSTPDHETVGLDPDRPRLPALSAHPKRSLLAVFLFVLVAGFLGGPVAGSLESSGGFATNDADSVRAIERIEAATGKSPGSGVVLLVDTPGRPARGRRPGRRGDRGPGGRARHRRGDVADHDPRQSRGDRPGVRGRHAGPGARDAHLGRRGRHPRRVPARHVRGSGRRGRRRLGRGRLPARQHDQRGPRPGRAVRLPAPDHPVADLLPRPRRTDAARRRDHHGARHLPGADRGQRGLRDEHLRAQPGDRPRPRPGDRLHAVPGDPLPRGARGPGADRRRDRHHHAHRGPDRRVLRGHGRGRADRPHRRSRSGSSSRWASPARSSRSSRPPPRW